MNARPLIISLLLLLTAHLYGQTNDSLLILNAAIEQAVHSPLFELIKKDIESRGHQPVLWNLSKVDLDQFPKVDTVYYEDSSYLIVEKEKRDFLEIFDQYQLDVLPMEWSIYLNEVKSDLRQGNIQLHFSNMIDSTRSWDCIFRVDNDGVPVLLDCNEKADSLRRIKKGITEYSGSWHETYTHAEALAYIREALDIAFQHPYSKRNIIENIEQYDTARILNASGFELCDSTTVESVVIDEYEIPFYTCKSVMSYRVRDLFINGGTYFQNEDAYNFYRGALVIGRIELNANGTLEIMLCEIGGLFMRRYHFIHYRGKYPTLINVQ